MWHLEHELEPWFEEVKRAREEKYGTGGGDSGDTKVPLMQNELAEQMKRR